MIALPDGTYVEAWVGYRQWNMLVSAGRVRLHPITLRQRTHRWEPGEVLTARCLCANHELEPRCGFHAWAATPRAMLVRPHVVWGEAYLWGEVNVFEKGYRAQHAMVAALYVYDGMDERNRLMVEVAALQYNVPTVVAPLIAWRPWVGHPHVVPRSRSSRFSQ